MNYKQRELNKSIKLFGKEPANLDELGEFCIKIIDSQLKDSRVLGFKWDIRYDSHVSNSHDCPIIGVTNWRREDDKPKGYPGFSGRVWIRLSEEIDSFASDLFWKTFTHPGTGGFGSYSGPFTWISNCYFKRFGHGNSTYPKPVIYSWDYRFFLPDFPLILEYVNNYRPWLILQDKSPDFQHIFEWYDAETLEADNLFIGEMKDLVC